MALSGLCCLFLNLCYFVLREVKLNALLESASQTTTHAVTVLAELLETACVRVLLSVRFEVLGLEGEATRLRRKNLAERLRVSAVNLQQRRLREIANSILKVRGACIVLSFYLQILL